MYKIFIASLVFLISNVSSSFEHKFAVNSNTAQIFVSGVNLGLEYNPNNLPFNIEIFGSTSRERPGDDLIEQKYAGLKISYNVTGGSGLEPGLLIRSGVENVDLDYYWDDKDDCVAGCPGNNYRSKKGSAQFNRYNLGIGGQLRTHVDWNWFGRDNYILYRLAVEKNFSGQDEVDAVDRNGIPLKEKLSQFNGYSLFMNIGIIF